MKSIVPIVFDTHEPILVIGAGLSCCLPTDWSKLLAACECEVGFLSELLPLEIKRDVLTTNYDLLSSESDHANKDLTPCFWPVMQRSDDSIGMLEVSTERTKRIFCDRLSEEAVTYNFPLLVLDWSSPQLLQAVRYLYSLAEKERPNGETYSELQFCAIASHDLGHSAIDVLSRRSAASSDCRICFRLDEVLEQFALHKESPPLAYPVAAQANNLGCLLSESLKTFLNKRRGITVESSKVDIEEAGQAFGCAWNTLRQSGFLDSYNPNSLRKHNRFDHSIHVAEISLRFACHLGYKVVIEDSSDLPASTIRIGKATWIYLHDRLKPERQAWLLCHEIAHLTLEHRAASEYGLDTTTLSAEERREFAVLEKSADTLADIWCSIFSVMSQCYWRTPDEEVNSLVGNSHLCSIHSCSAATREQ
jgi:hypothetical protein